MYINQRNYRYGARDQLSVITYGYYRCYCSRGLIVPLLYYWSPLAPSPASEPSVFFRHRCGARWFSRPVAPLRIAGRKRSNARGGIGGRVGIINHRSGCVIVLGTGLFRVVGKTGRPEEYF